MQKDDIEEPMSIEEPSIPSAASTTIHSVLPMDTSCQRVASNESSVVTGYSCIIT